METSSRAHVPSPLRAHRGRTRTAGLAVAILGAATALGTFGVTPALGETADALVAAEVQMKDCINAIRADAGLRPLRMDWRVRRTARERVSDMARHDYFGHVQPDGRDAGDLLRRDGIKWFWWGEAIGWTTWTPLEYAVQWQCDWWEDSPPHYAEITSRKFNYLGVGLTMDGKKLLSTVVFIQGPDRTRPYVELGDAPLSPSSRGGGEVTVSWAGADRPLATLTAGLDSFDLQRRRADGTWSTVLWKSTATRRTFALDRGEHAFRVRSRDNRGNLSGWTDPLAVSVH